MVPALRGIQKSRMISLLMSRSKPPLELPVMTSLHWPPPHSPASRSGWIDRQHTHTQHSVLIAAHCPITYWKMNTLDLSTHYSLPLSTGYHRGHASQGWNLALSLYSHDSTLRHRHMNKALFTMHYKLSSLSYNMANKWWVGGVTLLNRKHVWSSIVIFTLYPASQETLLSLSLSTKSCLPPKRTTNFALATFHWARKGLFIMKING